eukprot:1972481-Prymnesium_polylepis.1
MLDTSAAAIKQVHPVELCAAGSPPIATARRSCSHTEAEAVGDRWSQDGERTVASSTRQQAACVSERVDISKRSATCCGVRPARLVTAPIAGEALSISARMAARRPPSFAQ